MASMLWRTFLCVTATHPEIKAAPQTFGQKSAQQAHNQGNWERNE
jgi:hypothetical protein